jgi:hypothetical protein
VLPTIENSLSKKMRLRIDQIVTRDSAVIPGCLHDILMTNHSGLNKFYDPADPNFLKIVEAISRMVNSIEESNRLGRHSSSGSTPKLRIHSLSTKSTDISALPAKPWERAANLASRIYQKLMQMIEQLKEAKEDMSAVLTSLAVHKCFFESWAYRVGLIPLLESRLSLHELFSTGVVHYVCDVMQKMLSVLDTVSSTMASRNPHVEIQSLQDYVLHLLSLFSDINGSVQESIVSFRLLQQENIAPGANESQLLETLPGIEAMAAMKRINMLMKNSDAQRDSKDRLIIHIGKELKIDSAKSPFRSPGVYTKREDSAVLRRQVLVEWKRYESFWDTEVGNLLFRRVELLTESLRTASKQPGPLNPSILECLGYCHDEAKHRIGFVFGIPPSVSSRRSYIRLNQLLKQYYTNSALPPSVDDRVRLAQRLCRALFDFHKAEWYHRAFTSSNVLLFSEDEDSGTDHSDDVFVAGKYTILAPYVVGFGHSRPGGPGEFSEPAQLPSEFWRYQHPDYKNVPNQKYRHEFDYYSLGIVLLEIGQWKPLSAIMQGRMDLNKMSSHQFAEEILKHRCPELDSFVGEVYQQVVIDLMQPFQEDRIHLDQNELISVEKRFQFQTRVLESLGSWNLLPM